MSAACKVCDGNEFQLLSTPGPDVERDIRLAESLSDIAKRKQAMDAAKIAPALDESIHKGMAITGCKIYPPKKCRLKLSAVWANLPSATTNNERSGISGIELFNQIRRTYYYEGGPTPCDQL